MSARSKARRRALDILFEADVRGAHVSEILAARKVRADPPVSEYTEGLVVGVVENWREINDRIGHHAQGWTLDRMPPVDRNILRIAVFELGWRPDVPGRVVIDEAVELAKSLSTDRSPSFVNGLLGSLFDAAGTAARPGGVTSSETGTEVETGAETGAATSSSAPVPTSAADPAL
ncbi:transcription antitermination factor NusB [Frankia umida]|uniref:transcription antitermination factor NusB n=1 Tax=Frankia umida TaxID=573489 RepID=UPI0024B25DA3|nr:transcription antitermination factor NusB [Frankia umida]